MMRFTRTERRDAILSVAIFIIIIVVYCVYKLFVFDWLFNGSIPYWAEAMITFLFLFAFLIGLFLIGLIIFLKMQPERIRQEENHASSES